MLILGIYMMLNSLLKLYDLKTKISLVLLVIISATFSFYMSVNVGNYVLHIGYFFFNSQYFVNNN